VGRLATTYEPRRPADSVLYQIVRDHYETFRAQAASLRDGEGLPGFIDEEFRGFLRCGWLAGGFARFQCAGCGRDRLVPFSCKGRAVCPSCGGRRMAERAAHLVDHVFPAVPVRQWVLSLPHGIRYVLAWDHALCRAVVGVFIRAVLGYLRRRAREQDVADGRGGAVAIIQRFGAPDSQSIGFFAQGKLKKVGLSGEPPKSLADADVERQNPVGTWSREGAIVFGPIAGGGLYRVGADGGVPSPVTKVALAPPTIHRDRPACASPPRRM